MANKTVTINNKTIQITHPDRVVFADVGITKGELADYYTAVAPLIFEEIRDRPLSLLRCPGGANGKCFFQKHPAEAKGTNVSSIPITEDDGETREYFVVKKPEDILQLVQLNTLEIHAWQCRSDDIEHPDRMIFDLDPDPGVKPPQVVAAAKTLKKILEGIGLKSFVRVTGGKGLHIVVPISEKKSWDEVKDLSRSISEALAESDPSLFVTNMSKAKRKNKIFIDYLRNGRGATGIVNYSTRARAGAPVAMPLEWKDVKPGLVFNKFNEKNALAYIGKRKGSPWAGYAAVKNRLPR